MKTIRTYSLVLAALLMTITFALPAFAQDLHPAKEDVKPPEKEYSPYVEDHFPNNVYFGDTHLHSSWSADAGMAGATLGPDEAYRVSRGETVTAHSGWKIKLVRPLDFLVLADHAENLGVADFIRRSDPILLANKVGKRWHDLNKAGKGYEAFAGSMRKCNTWRDWLLAGTLGGYGKRIRAS